MYPILNYRKSLRVYRDFFIYAANTARITDSIAAHIKGRWATPAFPAAFVTTDMIKGDKNCAIYIAAESSGITVETASLPALCDAAAIIHGIPAPFEKPTMNDPIIDSTALDANAMIIYPAKKSAGATK